MEQTTKGNSLDQLRNELLEERMECQLLADLFETLSQQSEQTDLELSGASRVALCNIFSRTAHLLSEAANFIEEEQMKQPATA